MVKLLFLAGASCLLAAPDWKTQSFDQWSAETVHRILTDSPWTRPKTVRLVWYKPENRPLTYKDIPGADHRQPNTSGLGPLGGINPPKTKNKLDDSAGILIRWANALPVRHATAAFKFRDQKSGSLNSLIPAPEPTYIVELFGLPIEMAHGGPELIETIARDSAQLTLRSGRKVRASKVEALLTAESLNVRIHFPRTEPITVADAEVEVFADLQVFSIRERFRLNQMLYQGRLEL